MDVRSRHALQPGLSFFDGLIDPRLHEQLIGAVELLPVYQRRCADVDPTADPLDSTCFFPLAQVQDKRWDNAQVLLRQLDASLTAIADVWDVLRARLPAAMRLYECEYVSNGFGTEGHPHHDCLAPQLRAAHCTAIVYCNRDWALGWAGETTAFDARGEIERSVLPRPGRAALLTGDPLHVARPVARTCPWPRRVLVFKMWNDRLL